MAMGTRDGEQSPLWVATSDLPKSPGHPFYARLNAVLDAHHFDRFVEQLCQRFYASVMGRPSLAPGRYFRLLLLGYFEGIDAERGIAWRAMDSLAVRSFLGLTVHDAPPDHSTISRTRRRGRINRDRLPRQQGDTTTIVETAMAAAEQLADAQVDVDAPQLPEEIIASKSALQGGD